MAEEGNDADALHKEVLRLKCKIQETEAERDAYKSVISKQKHDVGKQKEIVEAEREQITRLEAELAMEKDRAEAFELQLTQFLAERNEAETEAQEALQMFKGGTPGKSPARALEDGESPYFEESGKFGGSFSDEREESGDRGSRNIIALLRQELIGQAESRDTFEEKCKALEEKLQEQETAFEAEETEMEDKMAAEVERRLTAEADLHDARGDADRLRAQLADAGREAEAAAAAAAEAQAAACGALEEKLAAAAAALAEGKETQAALEDAAVALRAARAREADRAAAAEARASEAERRLAEAASSGDAAQAALLRAEEELRAAQEARGAGEAEAKERAAAGAAESAALSSELQAAKKACEEAGVRVETLTREVAQAKTEAATTAADVAAAETRRAEEFARRVSEVEKAAALRVEQDTATVTAGYRSTLEKLKAKYEAQLHEARSLAAAPEPSMPPASLHASLNSSVSSHALDAEDMPAPLPLDLSTHEWLNVRSNFHHLRLRPQGVAKQWRVHDIKMFDAEGTNTCTDPNRMKVSGGSQGHGSDTCKVTGYWEAPLGSKDNSWIRYDLPALKVVWRVETRSSAEDGLQPLRLVLEGSRDGKEWVSVSWASGTVVKPQKVYHNGTFLQLHEKEVRHEITL